MKFRLSPVRSSVDLASMLFLALLFVAVAAQSSQPNSVECIAANTTGPCLVTPDCFDPMYATAVIDKDENMTLPSRHRRISGHFRDTDTDFNIYLPPESQWQGRFFSYVYPDQNSTATDQRIGFALDSGAYLIQVSGTSGYRADAAAAKFSRSILANHYRSVPEHVYGYIYGGSGGSYMTIGAMENTVGIWDGAVPIVVATPVSVPLNHAVRNLASVVLKTQSSHIVDSIRSGDVGRIMSNLSQVEAAVFREAALLGVPMEEWENFSGLASSRMLRILLSSVKSIDPSYADDYWSKPGYLGTENSTLSDVLHRNFVNFTATIEEVIAISDDDDFVFNITLGGLPDAIGEFDGPEFTLLDTSCSSEIGIVAGTWDPVTKTIMATKDNSAAVLGKLNQDRQIRVDNSWFIAMHTYHRHQIPTRPGFYGFDQFMGPDGVPLYPQRAVQAAAEVAKGACGGCTHSGNITGKMIIVDNLLDSDAFPWHADWYKSQVQRTLGSSFDGNVRLWYNERADHFFEPVAENLRDFIVDYTGMYEHAMRSLSAWVEDGIQPPASTSYRIQDSQVILSGKADERHGIQPIVELSMNSSVTGNIQRGTEVSFTMRAVAPDGAGKIIIVEWDFLGEKTFESIHFGEPNRIVDMTVSYAYEKPGTYLCVVKVTAQREGNSSSQFARTR
ncbi:pkd domain containing protein [Colletotrichum kahawae]|uniref:Pkd domain containing protein n=1 Tax=Colletotrichum kahawae TaxID=34407 RepID=A0AAE0D7Q1_COLKA|nr:pkd domain containing protein [Colletotrichum kahawae]